jgi:MtrB/PioB family decaheme-associated outer membrane protein
MRVHQATGLKAMLPALVIGMATGVSAGDDFFFDYDELDDVVELEYYDSFIEFGLGYLDGGTSHFGRNSGLERDGFSPVVDFRARGRPEWDGESAYYWWAEGRRLGWDSRRLALEAGEQGRQVFSFSWREMPNYQIEDGLTPFRGIGSGFLSLPPGWEVTGNTTSGMTALRDDLRLVGTGTDRRRLDLGYWRSFEDRWTFSVDARHETRQGSRAQGAIFGFTGGNPRGSQLPMPVDTTTRIIDAGLEYGGDSYALGLAYHGSFFENSQPSVAWQNPFGAHPGWAPGAGFPEGVGRISLFPDNQAHQLRTYGAWQVGDTTRLNADLAVGRMEQDDTFLPFTVNPFIDLEAPLPRDHFDGEIRTTLLNLRATTRPADRLNLTFNYRYDDRDNRSPMDAYRLVGADSEQQKSPDNARINLPYSYRKQELKGDANWRFARRNRAVGGLWFTREDRDNYAEAAELDEWGISAGLRGALSPRVNYRVDVEYADRTFDEYDGRAPYVAGRIPGTVGPEAFENHPNLRMYNMADRQRNQLGMRLDFQPIDVASLGFGYQYSKDDYDDSTFGLNDARVQSLSADLGYYPNEHLSITALYTHDRYKASQSGRDWPGNQPQLAFNPGRNWFVDHEDTIDTAMLSLELADLGRRFDAISRMGLNRRLDVGGDILFIRTRGEIDVTTGDLLNAEPLPDTVSRLNGYQVWARYQITPNWHTRLSVEHERFDSRNFALDEVDIDTLANVLLLGRQSPSYNVTWVMMTLGYQF